MKQLMLALLSGGVLVLSGPAYAQNAGPGPDIENCDVGANPPWLFDTREITEEQALAQAQAGDVLVQVRLAEMYLRADCPEHALHWYGVAAESDDPQSVYAQRDLGLMYRDGQGVERDIAEAIRWLSRAAGHTSESVSRWQSQLGAAFVPGIVAQAREALGQIFFEGLAGEPDDATAISWFVQAYAMHDDSVSIGALLHIAEAYELGRGVEYDEETAIMWYARAITAIARRVDVMTQPRPPEMEGMF